LTLQGLSIYSSGDEDKIDGTCCASTLWARIFAPHDALAKFLRSFPFFDEPAVDGICWLFADDGVPFDELINGVSDDPLFWLSLFAFPIHTKRKLFKLISLNKQT
jgi:hypothetical protein